eukprot:1333955-Pyramimonas_sp.AAC.1
MATMRTRGEQDGRKGGGMKYPRIRETWLIQNEDPTPRDGWGTNLISQPPLMWSDLTAALTAPVLASLLHHVFACAPSPCHPGYSFWMGWRGHFCSQPQADSRAASK